MSVKITNGILYIGSSTLVRVKDIWKLDTFTETYQERYQTGSVERHRGGIIINESRILLWDKEISSFEKRYIFSEIEKIWIEENKNSKN